MKRLICALLLPGGAVFAANPLPLSAVPVPEPPNLATYVKDKAAAIRLGKALFWDKERRKPAVADESWAARWEKRSEDRGKPNQIIGWKGGEKGSTLEPPEYQKLEGPWINGKDPSA